MHDGDHFATLGIDDCTNSSDGNVDNLMIIDPLNISLSADSVNDTDVVACNAAVGTAIDEGSPLSLAMACSTVNGIGGVDGPVLLLIS
jgi:hypothetical protein